MTEYLNGVKTESTRQTREKHLRLFYKWLLHKTVPVFDVKPGHIQEYKQYISLNKRCSPRSVASYLQTLKDFYRYVKGKGLVQSNPSEHHSTNGKNVIRMNIPDQALREFAGYYLNMGLRDFLIFSIMVLPGLRPDEISNIRVDSVFMRPVPHIRLDEDSYICINPNLVEPLKHYLRHFPKGEYLFHDENGGKVPESTIRRIRRQGMKRVHEIYGIC